MTLFSVPAIWASPVISLAGHEESQCEVCSTCVGFSLEEWRQKPGKVLHRVGSFILTTGNVWRALIRWYALRCGSACEFRLRISGIGWELSASTEVENEFCRVSTARIGKSPWLLVVLIQRGVPALYDGSLREGAVCRRSYHNLATGSDEFADVVVPLLTPYGRRCSGLVLLS